MANVYNRGKYVALAYDMDAITIKAILLDSDFAFNEDHNTVSQISGDRVSTDQTLASLALVEDDTANSAYVDAADPTWTAVGTGPTITGMVVYRSTGAEATDDLISFVNTTDTPANGGNITITINAQGILQIA